MLGIDDAIAEGLKIANKFIPDKDMQAKFESDYKAALLAADAQEAAAQSDVNKVEAANSSLFVSGWRPAVGWTCASAFFYNYVLQPFLAFAMANYTGHQAILPIIDMEVLGWTLTGMLGLGGSMRTFEKIKGVSK